MQGGISRAPRTLRRVGQGMRAALGWVGGGVLDGVGCTRVAVGGTAGVSGDRRMWPALSSRRVDVERGGSAQWDSQEECDC